MEADQNVSMEPSDEGSSAQEGLIPVDQSQEPAAQNETRAAHENKRVYDFQLSASAPVDSTGQPLSKRALKRKLKLENSKEFRKQKRLEERQRRKEKRKVIRESGQGELLKPRKFYTMGESSCPITVVVDMSYQLLMNEELIRKTINQLNFCYGVNRRSPNPLQYHITHLNGRTREIFDTYPGYQQWDVHFHKETIAELWAPGDVVYLTSDSENVLEDLDPKKAYIIGGLLDHNAHKGASLAKAKANKFHHARLPIDEYIKLETRRVLTINHVFEILIRFWETKSWEQAFFSVIPKRKGIAPRDQPVSNEVAADPPKKVGLFADACETVPTEETNANPREVTAAGDNDAAPEAAVTTANESGAPNAISAEDNGSANALDVPANKPPTTIAEKEVIVLD